MVRAVICDTNLQSYLTELCKNGFSYGLIIGQPSKAGKDYVVHLAKTPVSNFEDSESATSQELVNIDNLELADHALNTLRMLAGGLHILGIFVVSEKLILGDNAALQKLKTSILDIKSTLNSNGLLYANTDDFDGGDKLVFNYSSQSLKFTCKTISSDSLKAVQPKAADWKFVDSPVKWQEIETYYEVDCVFPLRKIHNQFDTEKSVLATIEVIDMNLKKSLMFYNGEQVEQDWTLEKFNKHGKVEGLPKIKATIFNYIPTPKTEEDLKISKFDVIHYSGVINSHVYGNERNTLEEIEFFIKKDLIRSLTTRLQFYYDALLANDDGGSETLCEEETSNLTNLIPPKRVFYPVGLNKLLFCDYLFQNEDEETVVKQVKDILDLDIEESSVIADNEIIVDGALNPLGDSMSSQQSESSSARDSKSIIALGIVTAAIVLAVSLILHFILN